MERFQKLIEDTSVYPESFQEESRRSSKHWITANWMQREADMRHDFCIMLLCNTEGIPDASIRISEGLKRKAIEAVEAMSEFMNINDLEPPAPKRRRFEDETNSDDSDNEEIIDESDLEDDVIATYRDSESEEEPENDEPRDEVVQFLEDQRAFRYIPIEGFSNEALLQNTLCERMGIPKPRKMFDIADTVGNRLIEVKVTVNRERAISNWNEAEVDKEHCFLYIVDLVTFDSGFYPNFEEKLPGNSKVITFLIQRNIVMGTLGISNNECYESEEISELVFSSNTFNSNLSNFRSFVLSKMNNFLISDLEKLETSTPVRAELTEMFNSLIDPTEISGEPIRWKGKLTPHFLCSVRKASINDVDSVSEFLYEIDPSECTLECGDRKLLGAYLELNEKWILNERNDRNFNILDFNVWKQKARLPPNLKEMLGICRKGVVHNREATGCRQREFVHMRPMRYDDWYDELISKYLDESIYKGYTATNPSVPEDQHMELYIHSASLINKIIRILNQRNLGFAFSHQTNFYSRVGSVYLATKSGSSNHGSIAAFPLLINSVDEKGEKARHMTGICVRGPQHARSAIDRINMIIIEKVPSSKVVFLKRMYKDLTIIDFQDPSNKLIIRQTAIKKVDSSHLMFIQNCIFSPVNLLGDMVLNLKTKNNEIITLSRIRDNRANIDNINFILDRMLDNYLMAIIGNSRDEGYLAIVRKIFMILLTKRRNNEAALWNMKEFCEKANDCLIDNPFSMNIQNTVLYCICTLILK